MTDRLTGSAPETKQAPETVADAFDDFMGAFEAFRETNDRRIGELETRLSGDVVTAEKLERINKAVDDHKRVLDQLVLRKARPALGRPGAGGLEGLEHRNAFETYVRRGDEAGLRQVEAKAFSYGSAADGGYLVPDELDTEIGKRLADLSPIRAISTVRQVSGAVLKKPFATAGMAAGWVGETDARPETETTQLAELQFPTMELYAMPAATASLLDDSAVDIEAWIASEVEAAFAEQEGAAFVAGDGINQPKGFLAYPTVADTAWRWGKNRHRRDRRRRRFRRQRPVRRARRHDLRAEGRPSPERQLRHEPEDAGRDPQVQGRAGQLSVAAAGLGRPARLADGFPRRRGGGHARHRVRTRCRSPSAISAGATSSSTGPACACCGIPIPPSPTSSSTRRSASAAASRTSRRSS